MIRPVTRAIADLLLGVTLARRQRDDHDVSAVADDIVRAQAGVGGTNLEKDGEGRMGILDWPPTDGEYCPAGGAV